LQLRESFVGQDRVSITSNRRGKIVQAGPPGNVARDEEIKRRAYEIYLGRGEQPGRDLDDWLQAERELGSGALSRAQAG